MREERQRGRGESEGGSESVPGPSRSHQRNLGKGSRGLGEHSLSTVPKGRHPLCGVTRVPMPACMVSMSLWAGKGPPLFPPVLFCT